jgi:hypothetical protein
MAGYPAAVRKAGTKASSNRRSIERQSSTQSWWVFVQAEQSGIVGKFFVKFGSFTVFGCTAEMNGVTDS